ncbi:hypothetical protein [Anabaena sp. UHCC 0204]|uniref:hypothetical protein n=1 Tax=Anabaena sp. UHCC 0204 TaxID=2590009 RepID=UPI0014481DC9|nr:hypothetical protein [Anabaena sp. UHCC 0204]MTJ07440.1 hypothetical protein [Anabaena sp. UHCC 0204]
MNLKCCSEFFKKRSLSSLLPSLSSCLRDSLKKDVGEGMRSLFGRVKGCDRFFSVSSVSLWFVKKGCLGVEECDRSFSAFSASLRFV